MNINIKELCKQIKKSRGVIWTVKNGTHFITNRHWAVRYSELPREVLIQLFSIFAEIPNEGETLNYDRTWDITRRDAVDFEKVFNEQTNGTYSGEVTPFLKVYEDYGNLRIIKIGSEVIYLKEEYMKMIRDYENSSPIGSNPMRPVSFNDNTFIILPVRTTNSRDDGIIKELLAS